MRVLMHPRTLEALRLTHPDVEGSRLNGGYSLAGVPITVSDLAPEFVERWEFPQEPFIEYESSDEPWARYFGFGRQVVTEERAVFVMGREGLLPSSVPPCLL